jgi:hypothetical protein
VIAPAVSAAGGLAHAKAAPAGSRAGVYGIALLVLAAVLWFLLR